MRPGTRLLSLFIVLGTTALLSLVMATYESPFVPPRQDMETASAANPRVTEHCETSGGAGGARKTTCYWTLRLDGDRRLAWPWPDPSGSVKETDAYLRQNAPITVRFWHGTVFEIEEADGHVYLSYDGAAAWEIGRQWFWIGVGVLVAVVSTARIGIELCRLQSAAVAGRSDQPVDALRWVSLVAGLTLPLARGDRIWWAMIALAGFSGVTDLVVQRVPVEKGLTCVRTPSRE
jgi:hypothetical protein